MGDISEHFSRHEFDCKCDYEDCVNIAVDVELVEVLEDVRQYFGKPFSPNCAYRCEKHNKDVGGVENSQHRLGTAADITIKGVDQHRVYRYLDGKYSDKYGIGKYNSFTHIDVRRNKARW